VTGPAAFTPKHSGIHCRTTPPIPAQNDPDNRAQHAESIGLEVEMRGRSLAGMGCNASLRWRSYAGQPIRWPNCSWADD
jgi:hypothetical protein